MANALTTLTHTLLAEKALEEFTAAITPMMAFSTNFSEATVNRGASVKVPFIHAQDAAADFATEYTVQDADMTGLDITINRRKYVSWGLSTAELADNPQVSLERFAKQKGFQLAKAVQQDIWSVITAANYANVEGVDKETVTAAAFDSDVVADLTEMCDIADWPENERALILKPSYINSLLKDSSIKNSDAFGSSGPQETGRISRNLFGFDIHMSNLVPANGESLQGFAANPDAILIASRVLVPENIGGVMNFEVVSDPSSGTALSFREWTDPKTDMTQRVLEFNYGFRVGNAAAIKRIVSA